MESVDTDQVTHDEELEDDFDPVETIAPERLDPASLGGGALHALFDEIYATASGRRALEATLPQLSGEALGIARWILLDYDACEATLGKTKNRSEAAETCLAYCTARKGERNRAAQMFEKLDKTYPDNPRHALGKLHALENGVQPFDAKAIAALNDAIDNAPAQLQDTADLLFYKGRVAELNGDYEEAVGIYSDAVEKDPNHRDALYYLAHQLDMRGADEEALECFQTLAQLPPVRRGTLLSLGTMYEDRGLWDKAAACFHLILDTDPTDSRARLFAHDIRASRSMFYDEDLEKKEDKLNQILRIPITDFELSVRARNCLNRMNIQTLGDLVKKSEAELLSYKNFGETSLNEIKEVLRPYGLRLGMERDDGTIDASKLQAPDPVVSQDKLDMPMSELQLSVRSRRTVDRLGCKSLRELCAKSEAELLAQPNFGHTSLNEIKHKLENLGLSLAKR